MYKLGKRWVTPEARRTSDCLRKVVPGTNLLAGRVSYDFNENLRIGTIFTNGDPRASGETRWWAVMLYGRTSKFRRKQEPAASVRGVRQRRRCRPGKQNRLGIQIDYPNDLWDCATSVINTARPSNFNRFLRVRRAAHVRQL